METKWDCPQCTYLNWSTSLKCSLCGSNKPYTICPPKSTIAKIKQTTQSSLLTAKQSQPSLSSDSSVMTWSCTECTCTNWSNVSLCTVCRSPRTTPIKSRISTRSESIFDCMGGVSNDAATPEKPRKQKRRYSPPHSRGHTPSSFSANKKWTCPSCTYENWPRSNKCIMCLSLPSTSLPIATAGATSLYTEDTTEEPFEDVPLSSRNIQRQIKNKFSMIDVLFLDACKGVLCNDMMSVKSYLKQGGDKGRQLTQEEVLVLNEPSKYTVGSTLVHLAVRFHQSDMLTYLLTPAPQGARKRLPSHINPELASEIRQTVYNSLCQSSKGEWTCHYINQLTTFILPQEINNLSVSSSQQLLKEIVDLDVQKELQEEAPIINWCKEINESSTLYPLWNRTAGDCLLDSALQATWGVVDREGTLRQALSDSLKNGSQKFYELWRESELGHAHAQEFNIEEEQLKSDWSIILSSAIKQGRPLEQIHIFVLSHILRRPVIVYGVKVVKNYKGEQLGLANFEGIYLPLLWDTSFCWRVPIALGYTRGHFSALVGMRKQSTSDNNNMIYLPLVDNELKPLPIHFIPEQEVSCHDDILQEYCDTHVTLGGVLTARQIISLKHEHSTLTQLIEEWIDKFLKTN